MLCRLFTAFASATPQPQEEDATWQPAFKLSYDLGCLVLRSSQTLPPVQHDRVAICSHMMRLTMQHQELVAAPTPVAGQGTHIHHSQGDKVRMKCRLPCVLCVCCNVKRCLFRLSLMCKRVWVMLWAPANVHMLLSVCNILCIQHYVLCDSANCPPHLLPINAHQVRPHAGNALSCAQNDIT